MPLSWQHWLQERGAQAGREGCQLPSCGSPLGRTPEPSGPGSVVGCVWCAESCPSSLTLSPSFSRWALCSQQPGSRRHRCPGRRPSPQSPVPLPRLPPTRELHLGDLQPSSQCPGPLSPQDQAGAPWTLPTKKGTARGSGTGTRDPQGTIAQVGVQVTLTILL